MTSSVPLQQQQQQKEQSPSIQQSRRILLSVSIPNGSSVDNTTIRSPSSSRVLFPRLVHKMLAEADDKDALSWICNGEAFVIDKSHARLPKIMAKYFQHAKPMSFIRQLNKYGWSKHRYGKYAGAWVRPDFHKNSSMQQLCSISPTCKSSVSPASSRVSSDPDQLNPRIKRRRTDNPTKGSMRRAVTRSLSSSNSELLVSSKSWDKKEVLKKKKRSIVTAGPLTRSSARKPRIDRSNHSILTTIRSSAKQDSPSSTFKNSRRKSPRMVVDSAKSPSIDLSVKNKEDGQDLFEGMYVPVSEPIDIHQQPQLVAASKSSKKSKPIIRLSLHGQSAPFSPITPTAVTSMLPPLNDSNMNNYWHPGICPKDSLLESGTTRSWPGKVPISTYVIDHPSINLLEALITTPPLPEATPSPSQVFSSSIFSDLTPSHFEPVPIKDFNANGVEFSMDLVDEYIDCCSKASHDEQLLDINQHVAV